MEVLLCILVYVNCPLLGFTLVVAQISQCADGCATVICLNAFVVACLSGSKPHREK